MRLDAITIAEQPDQYESLAVCLQALAVVEGIALDYDDICAALGVSVAAVSTTAESAPGWWMTFARDAFLQPAAALFGIRIGELDPRDPAIEMPAVEQGDRQPEDPIKSLIRASLRERQPVLAWQGWPDTSWPFWGIIVAEAGEDFEGLTIWSEGRRLSIGGVESLPLRCWAVEECEPGLPSRLLLFNLAMQHADAYMNRAPCTPVLDGVMVPEVVTGPAAFDHWERWLASEQGGAGGASAPWNEHRQNAELIAAARSSAARFLRRMQEVVDPARRELIAEAITHCETLVQRLSVSRDDKACREAFSTPAGRENLLADVHAAEAADRRLAACVEDLARPTMDGSGLDEGLG